jgi:hypothetical protein
MVGSHATIMPAVLVFWLVTTAGCHKPTPLSPSPIILPDAITVMVGEPQIFTVLNGSVVSFAVESDAGDWKQLVRVDAFYHQVNSIRLVALKPTAGGYIYVRANLGEDRSPLIAAMAIK